MAAFGVPLFNTKPIIAQSLRSFSAAAFVAKYLGMRARPSVLDLGGFG